ncbi:MAG: hypothetical protein J5J00_10920 [Deltaproteobacteria bacterium]|nr:hypothetical protein [Deltaproteobacteria bacterium]
MNKVTLSLMAAAFLTLPAAASAQETCTDEQKTALETCVSECKTTCEAANPGCTKTPISLEELRAAIAEECSCDDARNYGKYRSCVAHLINALKKFSLVDEAARLAIESDNKTCRDAIKDRRNSGEKGKGKGKGKGKNKES